ncbi:YggS family pyridoxal phosphate-dependent enzyme [Candidatus Woesearchaeota archaeon]|nr:MAG: YggS family pyridoxal phosphate-dependent enzyme [Candidatus Woesearchaeota archaeon]
MNEDLRANIERVRAAIKEAAIKAGRNPLEIRMLAATKNVGPERIMEAVRLGVRLIGENIVQEAGEKFAVLERAERDFFVKYNVERHFIGHLQRNKVRKALGLFDLIESVDSLRLAGKIDDEAERMNGKARVFLEVNIGREETKYGFLPEEVGRAARDVSRMSNISVEGLMCIPPAGSTETELREYFRKMRAIRNEISDISRNLKLSMGMSSDFAVAIEEGADIVRIGRAIFGERH